MKSNLITRMITVCMCMVVVSFASEKQHLTEQQLQSPVSIVAQDIAAQDKADAYSASKKEATYQANKLAQVQSPSESRDIKRIKEMMKNVDSDMRTIPIMFGFSTSIVISLLMVSIALYVSLQHADPLASTATLVSLPFFIFAAMRRMNKDILRAIRYPIFILNFFALPYYPWLVVPLFCTYYLSKYYYWHRFDLHYPTFLVDND